MTEIRDSKTMPPETQVVRTLTMLLRRLLSRHDEIENSEFICAETGVVCAETLCLTSRSCKVLSGSNVVGVS